MRQVSRLLKQLTIAILTLLAIPVTSIGQTITHDLQQVDGSGKYRVSGRDPYIIFNPQQQDAQPTHLILNLGDQANNAPIELFFKSDNDVFDSQYKLSFNAPHYPIALALPNDISVTPSTRLRLDVNHCSTCLISFRTPPILTQSPNDISLLEPTSVLNGAKQLDKNTNPIAINGWRLNDLSGDSGDLNNFEISGSDPFLVSPPLNISTQKLAGVFFKLKGPRSGQISNDYQFFYQTERHPFTAHASSILRIQELKTSDSLDQTIEFMVPLHFLSTESPADLVLKRIRLDLPEIPGKWSLIESRLVHQSQASENNHLLPSQLYHIKQQRATGLAIVKKALLNIMSDLGFLISYLLLLSISCVILVRSYRSSS